MALQIAWCLAWSKIGTERPLRELWSRIAYATRYGRITLTEAVELDQWQLNRFLVALNELVRQENGPAGSHEK